jgi:hypothetical protein
MKEVWCQPASCRVVVVNKAALCLLKALQLTAAASYYSRLETSHPTQCMQLGSSVPASRVAVLEAMLKHRVF